MRLLSIATCTSGEPVSPSTVLYSEMISVFWAVSSAMVSLSLPGLPGPAASSRRPGVDNDAAGEEPPGAAQTAGSAGGPCNGTSRPARTTQEGPGARHVVVDLLDQR